MEQGIGNYIIRFKDIEVANEFNNPLSLMLYTSKVSPGAVHAIDREGKEVKRGRVHDPRRIYIYSSHR